MDIIRVEPVPEHFSVTWMLGSLCNYDCMYCSADWHDTTSRAHDLETLQQAWRDIFDRSRHVDLPYKISFTGGEVTANKSFLPFAQWLRRQYGSSIAMLLITSNGSASLNWYQRAAEVVESISLSTHSEFMDEAEFFAKAREINKIMPRPHKSLHVNIMDEPWNSDRTPLYAEFCQRHGISYSINSIDMKWRVRDHHAALPEHTLERLD